MNNSELNNTCWNSESKSVLQQEFLGFYLKAWCSDAMSQLLSDENKKVLTLVANNISAAWSAASEGKEELFLPAAIRECGDRIDKFCKALGALLGLPEGDGTDVQFFKKYKGQEQFEKMVKNAFNQEGSFWQESYDEIVRTAASSRLAAPQLEKIKHLLKDGIVPTPDELCEGVAVLAEIKTGLRKGSTAEIETSLHKKVMAASTGIITSDSPGSIRSKTIDALLRALKGPLAPFTGSIQKADELNRWMTSKVSEIHEAELKDLVLKPIIDKNCQDLDAFDHEQLTKYVKSLAGVTLGTECLEMLRAFYFRALSWLHREVRLWMYETYNLKCISKTFELNDLWHPMVLWPMSWT